MTGNDFEQELRGRFRAMRQDEARGAPPFRRPVAEPLHGRHAQVPAWRGVLAAAAAVAVLVTLTWVLRSARQQAESRRVVAEWRKLAASGLAMPTDFLLEPTSPSLLRASPAGMGSPVVPGCSLERDEALEPRSIRREAGLMIKQLAMCALLAAACSGVALAEPPPPDPVAQFLFPPELVMQHQRELGLTASQRSTITDAIGKTQSKVLELQWDMHDETQKLAELLGAPSVDEAAVLAQVDRVLNVERQVKREHLSMLMKIKNSLTREQQEKLKALRERPPH